MPRVCEEGRKAMGNNDDIWIRPLECEDYLKKASAFGQTVLALMKDLQAAIDRAGNTWKDESIQRARAEAELCRKNLESAFLQLQPVLQKLKDHIDWAWQGLRM